MNLIFGNLFAGLLFSLGGSPFLFVLILSILAVIGLALGFLLKKPSKLKPTVSKRNLIPTKPTTIEDGQVIFLKNSCVMFVFLTTISQIQTLSVIPKHEEEPLTDQLLGTIRLFKSTKAQLLICPLIFLGLSNGYYYGSVPTRIGDLKTIGFVMTVYGVAEVRLLVVLKKIFFLCL
jgi:hypothetical protein